MSVVEKSKGPHKPSKVVAPKQGGEQTVTILDMGCWREGSHLLLNLFGCYQTSSKLNKSPNQGKAKMEVLGSQVEQVVNDHDPSDEGNGVWLLGGNLFPRIKFFPAAQAVVRSPKTSQDTEENRS